jgi:Zn-dependent peptidase ImmA (M78 family)
MELKKIEKIAMENVSHEKGGVDVVKMAHSYDINVYAADVDPSFNAEIQYNKDEDSYNIFVNSRHPLPRQRFSIAHEIAHFLLHQDLIQERGSLNRENGSYAQKSKIEREADKLAGKILMPTPLVKNYLKQAGITPREDMRKDVLLRIATYFRVSPYVAVLRLREMKHYVPSLCLS